MSGDSGGPSTQTVNNVNIPEYARPYVEDMLGRSQALTTQNQYQHYDGERVAGPTGNQLTSWNMAAEMKPSAATGQSNWAALDSLNRSNALADKGYSPGSFNAVGPYSISAPGGARDTHTQNFNDPGVAQSYMNPYMQQVVDIQKREATRNSNMMGQQQGAQAAGMGAFGGSRHAIVDAERERNLGTQLNDIQSQGSNAAWQQAQQAFQSDAGRGLQSQMANQGADLTHAGQWLDANKANQSNYMQFGQQSLDASKMGEQSRQFGASYGLQGAQQELAAAGMLKDIGQSDYNQNVGIAGLQNQFGSQQQALNQQGLDTNYQDWSANQEFPYKNLEFMSGIVHGLPLTQTSSSMYQQAPSPISQLAGAGTALYGASRAGMFAEGGSVDDNDAPHAGIVDLLISQIH